MLGLHPIAKKPIPAPIGVDRSNLMHKKINGIALPGYHADPGGAPSICSDKIMRIYEIGHGRL
jgi:hypothetical protein